MDNSQNIFKQFKSLIYIRILKKRGFGFNMFYILPLIYIKNIVFFTQHGLAGAIYNLTLDEKDAVTNEIEFLNFVKEKI